MRKGERDEGSYIEAYWACGKRNSYFIFLIPSLPLNVAVKYMYLKKVKYSNGYVLMNSSLSTPSKHTPNHSVFNIFTLFLEIGRGKISLLCENNIHKREKMWEQSRVLILFFYYYFNELYQFNWK